MRNQIKLVFPVDTIEGYVTKVPVIVGIALVYLSTVIFQYTQKVPLKSIIGCTIVMIFHTLIYWFSDTIFKRRYWLYFAVQGIIVFDYAVISPKGYETILLGLIPILILQSAIVFYDAIKVIVTSLFFYSIFCGTIILYDGVGALVQYIPILLLVTLGVRAYSAILFRQVKLRAQAQKVLQELEFAYEKVEELTLITERQRMARDLHDTLSQGLAGIIMQLEAVSANLNNNNTKRAQEIVQKSMEHARKTLSDSRLVIDDLRLQTNADVDLSKAVDNEIAAFKSVANISITVDTRIESKLPAKIVKHIIYIVREALNNIAKHSKAKHAALEIVENEGEININILDDGIGFDTKLLDRKFGHYGILGMTERVKAINGIIKLNSKRKAGTNVNIIIPIEKGTLGANG